MIQLLMRVMAGDAGEARIPVAPATAFLEPIRLKAHVLHAFYSSFKNVERSTVTGPAKIDLRDGPQTSWVENSLPTLLILFVVHELGMSGAGTMTSFAIHAKYEARRIKSCPGCGSGGVAPETTPQSIRINTPAQRRTQVLWNLGQVAWGKIQVLQAPEKAHPALVERAISLINVSLALVS